MDFKNSFILLSLIIEYIMEIVFVIDMFYMKFKVLPKLLNLQRIFYQNFSFYCDIISILPFEILLILPILCWTEMDIFEWMIWLRFPKLLRLRSFQLNISMFSVKNEKEDDTQNAVEDLSEIYVYKTSLNDRVTNLEKLLSSYDIPIFLWRYISFACVYLMVAHLMGGLWYLTGIWGENYYELTWIIRDKTVTFIDEHNGGVTDLYIRSFYFCLNATTTTGYGDIACTNPIETVFLLILIIVSVIMFASMVGLWQNATMTSDTHLARFQLQIEYTQSFMKRHRISSELNKRALQHFQYIWNRSKGVDESAILETLPSSLKGDIVLFMNKNLLQNVSWFKNKVSRGFIRSIATRLETHLFLANEVIFKKGDMGQHMFFINQGKINIVLLQMMTMKKEFNYDSDFFGHLSIIYNTPRTYTATANTVCELLSLSTIKFNELLNYEPNLPQMLNEQDIIIQMFGQQQSQSQSEEEEQEQEEENANGDIKIDIAPPSSADNIFHTNSESKLDNQTKMRNMKRRSASAIFPPHSKIQAVLASLDDLETRRERRYSMASFDAIHSFRKKLTQIHDNIKDEQL